MSRRDPGQWQPWTPGQQPERQRVSACREVSANVEPAEVVRRCRVSAKQVEIAALKQQLCKVGASGWEFH